MRKTENENEREREREKERGRAIENKFSMQPSHSLYSFKTSWEKLKGKWNLKGEKISFRVFRKTWLSFKRK